MVPPPGAEHGHEGEDRSQIRPLCACETDDGAEHEHDLERGVDWELGRGLKRGSMRVGTASKTARRWPLTDIPQKITLLAYTLHQR